MIAERVARVQAGGEQFWEAWWGKRRYRVIERLICYSGASCGVIVMSVISCWRHVRNRNRRWRCVWHWHWHR